MVRLLGFSGLVTVASLLHASDAFILAQASTSENMNRSSSGNSTDKKGDTVVISTPKPRERVVPQTPPQPNPPIQMPIIVMPTVPQK
jgi:hypothetical protein